MRSNRVRLKNKKLRRLYFLAISYLSITLCTIHLSVHPAIHASIRIRNEYKRSTVLNAVVINFVIRILMTLAFFFWRSTCAGTRDRSLLILLMHPRHYTSHSARNISESFVEGEKRRQFSFSHTILAAKAQARRVCNDLPLLRDLARCDTRFLIFNGYPQSLTSLQLCAPTEQAIHFKGSDRVHAVKLTLAFEGERIRSRPIRPRSQIR